MILTLLSTDHPYKMQSYVSHDLIADQGSFGSVMERFWLTSSGVALKVNKTADKFLKSWKITFWLYEKKDASA